MEAIVANIDVVAISVGGVAIIGFILALRKVLPGAWRAIKSFVHFGDKVWPVIMELPELVKTQTAETRRAIESTEFVRQELREHMKQEDVLAEDERVQNEGRFGRVEHAAEEARIAATAAREAAAKALEFQAKIESGEIVVTSKVVEMAPLVSPGKDAE